MREAPPPAGEDSEEKHGDTTTEEEQEEEEEEAKVEEVREGSFECVSLYCVHLLSSPSPLLPIPMVPHHTLVGYESRLDQVGSHVLE